MLTYQSEGNMYSALYNSPVYNSNMLKADICTECEDFLTRYKESTLHEQVQTALDVWTRTGDVYYVQVQEELPDIIVAD